MNSDKFGSAIGIVVKRLLLHKRIFLIVNILLTNYYYQTT